MLDNLVLENSVPDDSVPGQFGPDIKSSMDWRRFSAQWPIASVHLSGALL